MAWAKNTLLLFSLVTIVSFSAAAKPEGPAIPVTKDGPTLQYVTRVYLRDPLTLLNFVVDLGGRYLWVACDDSYVSSNYRPVLCGSPECKLTTSQGCTDCFGPQRAGCDNNTCSVGLDGATVGTGGVLAQDAFAVPAATNRVVGPSWIDNDFIFSCAAKFLLKGLARGANGMAGFGRGNLGLPLQLAKEYHIHDNFAICLPSLPSTDGVIFLGNGPYEISTGVDSSSWFKYTPLLINPVSTAGSYIDGEESVEYFIGVKSVKVDGKAVPLNATLLSIDAAGNGGTKISTVTPYTKLERSIYKAVAGAFASGMKNVSVAPPVKPFKLCYRAKDIDSLYTGPDVPIIDLVLQGDQSAYWRILGSNSMVEAKPGVLCLGIVDAGKNPRTSIVIGGRQIEDNLLQFDVANSRLGFTSTLWVFKLTLCQLQLWSRKLWKDILEGRDIIREGTLWRIGNGEKVQIWSDPWIPSVPGFRITERPPGDITVPERVSELIDQHDYSWDECMLRLLFTPFEVEAILKIRLPRRPSEDILVWAPIQSGVFTSKSAYHQLLRTAPSSSAQEMHEIHASWAKFAYQARGAAPRAIMFLWRAMQGGIPVLAVIARAFQVDTTCRNCRGAVETIDHAILHCPYAWKVWEKVGIPMPADWGSTSLAGLIAFTAHQRDPLITRKVCSFAWAIWLARNSWHHNSERRDTEQVMAHGAYLAESYNRGVAESETDPIPPDGVPENRTPQEGWQRPPMGVVKINIDGSCRSGKLAVGAVAHDHQGTRLASVAKEVGWGSPLEAEGCAIELGVEIFQELGGGAAIIEGDCKTIMDCINDRAIPIPWKIQHSIEMCRDLAARNDVTFSFVPRSCNSAAHQMASSFSRAVMPVRLSASTQSPPSEVAPVGGLRVS